MIANFLRYIGIFRKELSHISDAFTADLKALANRKTVEAEIHRADAAALSAEASAKLALKSVADDAAKQANNAIAGIEKMLAGA